MMCVRSFSRNPRSSSGEKRTNLCVAIITRNCLNKLADSIRSRVLLQGPNIRKGNCRVSGLFLSILVTCWVACICNFPLSIKMITFATISLSYQKNQNKKRVQFHSKRKKKKLARYKCFLDLVSSVGCIVSIFIFNYETWARLLIVVSFFLPSSMTLNSKWFKQGSLTRKKGCRICGAV